MQKYSVIIMIIIIIVQEKVETRKEDVKPAGLFNFLSYIKLMCKIQHNNRHSNMITYKSIFTNNREETY